MYINCRALAGKTFSWSTSSFYHPRSQSRDMGTGVKPIISEILIQQPVLFLSVYGNVPEDDLLQATRDVRDDLIDLPDVSMASLVSGRDYEIAIEINTVLHSAINSFFK